VRPVGKKWRKQQETRLWVRKQKSRAQDGNFPSRIVCSLLSLKLAARQNFLARGFVNFKSVFYFILNI
jgi:hypothetical protein